MLFSFSNIFLSFTCMTRIANSFNVLNESFSVNNFDKHEKISTTVRIYKSSSGIDFLHNLNHYHEKIVFIVIMVRVKCLRSLSFSKLLIADRHGELWNSCAPTVYIIHFVSLRLLHLRNINRDFFLILYIDLQHLILPCFERNLRHVHIGLERYGYIVSFAIQGVAWHLFAIVHNLMQQWRIKLIRLIE